MMNIKAYVLFYTTKAMLDKASIEINHYKYFLDKKDLEKFLCKQGAEFTPIAIQRLNVSKSTIVDKRFSIINNFMKVHK